MLNINCNIAIDCSLGCPVVAQANQAKVLADLVSESGLHTQVWPEQHSLGSAETFPHQLLALMPSWLGVSATEGAEFVRHHGVLAVRSLARLQVEAKPRPH